jgi:nucleolar protein 15
LLTATNPTEPEYESEEELNKEPSSATTISKRGKSSSKRKQKDPSSAPKSSQEKDSNAPTSVIYLGHLPTAFEERELLIFLNQFGPVNKCRVSRSTKTGRSRGYAFVEFADVQVAQIVAEAMNGYFLLEKRLVCHVLPEDKVYDLMFKRSKKVVSKKMMQDKAREEVNRRKTPEVMRGITAKLIEREEAKRRKLVELGIDYDFPGYAASAAKSGDKEEGKKAKKRKVSMDDDKENSADETEENVIVKEQVVKTPKKGGKKKDDKANTEVKKDKKKKEKKRKSLA